MYDQLIISFTTIDVAPRTVGEVQRTAWVIDHPNMKVVDAGILIVIEWLVFIQVHYCLY